MNIKQFDLMLFTLTDYNNPYNTIGQKDTTQERENAHYLSLLKLDVSWNVRANYITMQIFPQIKSFKQWNMSSNSWIKF